MNGLFKTIKSKSEGFYKEKSSKFLAFAYPVTTEEEIKEIQKELRKKFFDARHHVYAFVLGAEKNIFRYSDDGEPTNSSGPPVLNAIKSFDLTNILVVVVRYFGGKKLGVSGLIVAYRAAAEIALNNAVIIEKQQMQRFKLVFDFSKMNKVMHKIKSENIEIISQNFLDNCVLEIDIIKSKKIELEKFFLKIGVTII
jgi:uncharacterized YigZ family protein